jgi:gamma-glutamyltranspeptidase / glutathione hydrolase
VRLLAILVAALLVLPLAGCLGPGRDDAPPLPVLGTGVIAVVHPLAAEAGAKMLRMGGNAMDAAAAVQWALNVVEPSMSGLGGGTLIVYWDNATKQVHYFDGREMAPAASTPDQFLLPGGQAQSPIIAQTRGYAVGVPGTLRLFEMVEHEHGRLSLTDTFEPAIRIATDGFVVDAYLAGYVAASEAKLRSWPASARLYFPGSTCPPELLPTGDVACVGGAPLQAGTTWRNADLAKTFRLIQSKGTEAFYQGEVADAIVATQAQRQGRMVKADLQGYEPKERSPVEADFRGAHVVSAAPPSAGGLTMLQMLKILEGFDLRGWGPESVDTLHVMIESMHLAYADRYAYIGDSDFVDVPMRGLLHPDYAAERRALIDMARARDPVAAGDPWKYEAKKPASTGSAEQHEGDHTTHFTVVDGEGNVAAVTTTLESLFGNGMVVPGYGFLLNNQMTDFDFKPGGPNQVEPKKRPRSSMAPTIVFDQGRPVLALGSPGGPTITTTVLQVLLNVAEHGQSLPTAVKSPRIFTAAPPGVAWESGIAASTRDALNARGHQMNSSASRIGNVQAVQWSAGQWLGVADTRAGQGAVLYVAPDEVVSRPG